jgi:RNA polymerase sigma factor (sigma-70 family)
MVNGQAGIMLRQLRKLAGVPPGDELSDGQLLERFTAHREEAAFAALVKRHGPMVLGVCRRVLHDLHDADDAFQATFLVLIRRAAALDRRAPLGNWLYTVAYHIALKARVLAARRRARERQAVDIPGPATNSALAWSDLRPVLDEEINHLPPTYRTPFILCYLEGKTNAEAARLLGVPANTVKTWLARARDRMRGRLTRRGLTLSAGGLSALLADHAAAALPVSLVETTVRTAFAFAAGQAPPAAAISLAEGALMTMLKTKLKLAALLVLALGLIGLGVAAAGQRGPSAPDRLPAAGEKVRRPKLRQPKAIPPKAAPGKKDEAESMTFTGQVLNENGKPVAKADLAVLGQRKPTRPNEGWRQQVLVTGKTDAQGKFRLQAKIAPRLLYLVHVLATAKGYGMTWKQFMAPGRKHKVNNFSLPAEKIITGRLFDLQGQPAAKVKCRVTLVMDDRYERQLARQWGFKRGKGRMPAAMDVMRRQRGMMRRQTGYSFTSDPPPKGLSLWPKPVLTDAQGRFRVKGFGRGQAIDLLIEDDRFALQKLTMEADKPGKKEFTQALAAPQKFEGEVVAADTGKPVPKSWVSISGFQSNMGQETGLYADAKGHFKINPYPGNFFTVRVLVQSKAPYLGAEFRVNWPKGATRHKLRIELPRGVRLRGKVRDKTTGKPVPWVRVFFQPQQKNNPKLPRNLPYGPYWPATSDQGGNFRLVVPTGPGYLLAKVSAAPGSRMWRFGETPGQDFIRVSVGTEQLQSGQPGGHCRYFHAAMPLNLKPQPGPKGLTVSLRRGVTLKGQVVGPDGKAVTGAILFGPGELFSPQSPQILTVFNLSGINIPLVSVFKDGKFEVPGCDPDKTYRVSFLGFRKGNMTLPRGPLQGYMIGQFLTQMTGDGKNCLGATVDLSAKKAAGKPLTIKLAPCGSATVSLVDPKGKPARVNHAWLELVVTPRQGQAKNAVLEEVVPVSGVNAGYGGGILVNGPVVKNPRKFPGLIPGATYRLKVLGRRFDQAPVEKEFTVKSGQVLKMKDIVIKESE